MDWTLFEAMYLLPYGWPLPARWTPGSDAEPTEADIWITRLIYEFVVGRNEKDTQWRIGVRARCRGWRRHRHTALATGQRGELRFGDLLPN